MTIGDQKFYLFVCMADCHPSSLCSEHPFLLCIYKAQWCLNPTGSSPVHWSSHPSTCCFQGDSSHAVMDLDVRWMSGGVAHSKTHQNTTVDHGAAEQSTSDSLDNVSQVQEAAKQLYRSLKPHLQSLTWRPVMSLHMTSIASVPPH